MKRERVKRAYDGSGRKRAALDTRAAILEASRRLFVTHGYAATTLAEVARAAKVAVDTIYASVGTKQRLLKEVVESAISGANAAVPAEQRDYVRAIRAATGARDKLAIYATAIRHIHERLAPLLRVLDEAATTDEELADLWKKIARRRAENMRLFVDDLVATGDLRADLDRDEAADMIWATNAPEFYLLLVDGRKWSGEKFERWLARTWTTLLIGETPLRHHGSTQT